MTIKDLKDKNLLLFECLSGSKAYGLATPQSDTDIKGIFYIPKEMFFGLWRLGGSERCWLTGHEQQKQPGSHYPRPACVGFD